MTKRKARVMTRGERALDDGKGNRNGGKKSGMSKTPPSLRDTSPCRRGFWALYATFLNIETAVLKPPLVRGGGAEHRRGSSNEMANTAPIAPP